MYLCLSSKKTLKKCYTSLHSEIHACIMESYTGNTGNDELILNWSAVFNHDHTHKI